MLVWADLESKSLFPAVNIGDEISHPCSFHEGSNTNTGREVDIPGIIIQTRGLQMEVKTFQPAWWCHGGEKALDLIQEFACSPTSCWGFFFLPSFLPTMHTEGAGDFRLHGCVCCDGAVTQ